MGVQNIVGTMAYVIAPYFLLIMQNKILFQSDDSTLGFGIELIEKDMVQGAADLAIIIGIVVVVMGVMPFSCANDTKPSQ